jgi:hypothetical protein
MNFITDAARHFSSPASAPPVLQKSRTEWWRYTAMPEYYDKPSQRGRRRLPLVEQQLFCQSRGWLSVGGLLAVPPPQPRAVVAIPAGRRRRGEA